MAIQCLSEAYGVDLSSASQRAKYDIKPTLEVRMRGKGGRKRKRGRGGYNDEVQDQRWRDGRKEGGK